MVINGIIVDFFLLIVITLHIIMPILIPIPYTRMWRLLVYVISRKYKIFNWLCILKYYEEITFIHIIIYNYVIQNILVKLNKLLLKRLY